MYYSPSLLCKFWLHAHFWQRSGFKVTMSPNLCGVGRMVYFLKFILMFICLYYFCRRRAATLGMSVLDILSRMWDRFPSLFLTSIVWKRVLGANGWNLVCCLVLCQLQDLCASAHSFENFSLFLHITQIMYLVNLNSQYTLSCYCSFTKVHYYFRVDLQWAKIEPTSSWTATVAFWTTILSLEQFSTLSHH